LGHSILCLLLCVQMNGSGHPAVPGLKLSELTESAAENTTLSPVAGKHIGSNGSTDDTASTAVVLPPASRRASENKVSFSLSWCDELLIVIYIHCVPKTARPH